MSGKQNEPNEKEPKAVSGTKPEAKLEQVPEIKREEKQVRNPPAKADRKEDVYTMEDFADNSRALFGVRKEIVVAAFRDKKITMATKEEAKKIIEEFKKREVK